MKSIFIIIILFTIFISVEAYSQLYQGPANGSVPNGVVVTTGDFDIDMSGEPIPQYLKKPRNEEEEGIKLLPDYLNKINATGPEGSNFVRDGADNSVSSVPLLIKKFPGIPQTNSIPPDTYIAAGPTYLMGVVNTIFYIWDKNGSIVRNINSASWFNSALSGADPFDPKVTYDHFDKRWIMVWLDQSDSPQRGYYLISVSDDSIPTGTWYNWAIKSTLNGDVESGAWGDYQGVGFDSQALYLSSNQFQFGGGFIGAKIRVIGKAQLYNNTAGPLVWTDFWDMRDPGNPGVRLFGIRPSIIYGSPSEYYFLCSAPFFTGTYMSLYKLVNPLNNPVITGVDVPVVSYSTPPNAGQLGGGAIPIEGGGANLRNEPTYRNGSLYAVHAVASGGGVYSAVSYLKINPVAGTADEDYVFGEDGFWHFYPAIGIDKDQNVAMTFSRSGVTEYAGAYYNTRLNSDPPGTFSGSRALQPGQANYVVDFGTGRNRWGDYMGISLDPSDQSNLWIHTEYAALPVNRWDNKVGLLRLTPYTTARIFTDKDSLSYGNWEVNSTSDTQSVKIINYGTPTLTISNIQVSNSEFHILNSLSFPVNLNFTDSLVLRVVFKPTSAGVKNDSMTISSNDVTRPLTEVYLKAKGYVINPVSANVIYGVTGTQSNGSLLTINPTNGSGTNVGQSGFVQLNGVSIRPTTNKLYSSITSSPASQLVRVNATGGDAYFDKNIPFANIRAIAFDTNDELFCSSSDGKIYKFNIVTNDTLTIGSTGITNLLGISINPVNRQLWGMNVGGSVYKVNKQTAVSQLIGATGQSPASDIAFDKNGKLYGIKGIGLTVNSLVTIDTSTGAGTLIGSIGFAGTNGIAISPEIVGIQNITTTIPNSYELFQNYPNPFNPVTKINYSLPTTQYAILKVYDALGKEVATLVNEKQNAGTYSVDFDASNFSSGIYFYMLTAENFVATRKMLLVK